MSHKDTLEVVFCRIVIRVKAISVYSTDRNIQTKLSGKHRVVLVPILDIPTAYRIVCLEIDLCSSRFYEHYKLCRYDGVVTPHIIRIICWKVLRCNLFGLDNLRTARMHRIQAIPLLISLNTDNGVRYQWKIKRLRDERDTSITEPAVVRSYKISINYHSASLLLSRRKYSPSRSSRSLIVVVVSWAIWSTIAFMPMNICAVSFLTLIP